jgi:DNA-binding MarR family transcriptional regulator
VLPRTSAADTQQLARDLLEAVGKLRRQARRTVGSPWPGADLTGSQIELLRSVRRRPGSSVTEIAAELGVAANTVSTLVGQLGALGLLYREPDERDRRVGRLTLTATALARLEGWRDSRVAAIAASVARLEPSEREALSAAVPVLAQVADELGTTAAPASTAGREAR